jgi:hypothetical protein
MGDDLAGDREVGRAIQGHLRAENVETNPTVLTTTTNDDGRRPATRGGGGGLDLADDDELRRPATKENGRPSFPTAWRT